MDGVIDSSVRASKLQKLKEWLARNNFEASAYQEYLAALDLSHTDFQHLYRFSRESYTRTMLAKTDSYELILICWERGQMSSVHNHGFSQCFVRCLEGSMCENRYTYQNNEMRFNATKRLSVSGTAFINQPDVFHELANASGTTRAVSLHLYSPKITHYYLFDKSTGTVSQCDF